MNNLQIFNFGSLECTVCGHIIGDHEEEGQDLIGSETRKTVYTHVICECCGAIFLIDRSGFVFKVNIPPVAKITYSD